MRGFVRCVPPKLKLPERRAALFWCPGLVGCVRSALPLPPSPFSLSRNNPDREADGIVQWVRWAVNGVIHVLHKSTLI